MDSRRFRRAGRVRGAAVLAAAALGVAGCSGATDGAATPVETVATSPDSGQPSDAGSSVTSSTVKSETAALWDPCALPESVLTGTGVDPSSKDSGIADVDFTDADWKICTWRATAGWYSLTVFSGTPTLDEIQERPDYTGYKATTVGAYEGVQFHPTGATASLSCSVAVGLHQGSVTFRVFARPAQGAKEDPCLVANRHASDLAAQLPEQ